MKDGKGTFSWREFTSDKPLSDSDRRMFIQIRPILDFGALEPGKAATDAIRKAAVDTNIAGLFDARVRLTGPVPIANEEFATVQDGAILNGVITVLIVLAILWAALHSLKIIFAVFVTLAVGLVATTAAGLILVGSFNLISIAFAVLFVGLGVDFGIQYSVRYRSERHKNDDLPFARARCKALRRTLVACRDGDGCGLSVVSADRLRRRFATRQGGRCRHGDRVLRQHHTAAGAARSAKSAR